MKSICRVIPEAEIKRLNSEDKNDIRWEFQDYLFSGIELEDDVSLGQRAFNRNVNGLCAQLINFYQKAWPKQHDETLERIRTEQQEIKKKKKEHEAFLKVQ